MKLTNSNNPRRQARRRGGFTLVELLLVLAILAILAGLVLPKFSGRAEQARETAALSQISSFKTMIDAFEVDNGYYPKSLIELIQKPADANNWRGPYLDKPEIPLDPWGRQYIYEFPGKHNPASFDLISMGADGKAGSEDDVTNWQQSNQKR